MIDSKNWVDRLCYLLNSYWEREDGDPTYFFGNGKYLLEEMLATPPAQVSPDVLRQAHELASRGIEACDELDRARRVRVLGDAPAVRRYSYIM